MIYQVFILLVSCIGVPSTFLHGQELSSTKRVEQQEPTIHEQAQAHYQAGINAEKQGTMREAELCYKKAAYDYTPALLSLGYLYSGAHKTVQATKEFIKAAEQGDAQGQLMAGLLAQERGDIEQAKEYFLAAHTQKEPEATYKLGLLCMHEGKKDKAYEYIALAAARNYPRAQAHMAFLSNKAGNNKKALELYTQAAVYDNGARLNLAYLTDKHDFQELTQQANTDGYTFQAYKNDTIEDDFTSYMRAGAPVEHKDLTTYVARFTPVEPFKGAAKRKAPEKLPAATRKKAKKE